MIRHIPTFLQDYREIKYIIEAIKPEVVTFNQVLDKILDGQFIFDAPIEFIKRFEEMHKISSDDTIANRRINLYILYNNAIPYDKKTINDNIYEIVPKDFVAIDAKPQLINVYLKKEYSNKANIIDKMLRKMLPLNMVIRVIEKSEEDISYNSFIGNNYMSTTIEMINIGE